MKNLIKTSVMFALTLIVLGGTIFTAKSQSRTTLAVLNIDTQGFDLTSQQMGNLVRIELEKLDTFDVLDRYDVAYLIEKHDISVDNCYGKICLVEAGMTINTQKMLSGSVEMYGKTTIVTFRLIDVASSTIERTHVREFLDLPEEIQPMLRITLREMFDLPVDKNVLRTLTKRYDFETAVNNPNKVRLALAGPRMGATLFTGKTAGYLADPRHMGGYDAFPLMFQFGYQIELQYLNRGNFQAIAEFLPTITGLDQSLIIPSVSLMNGLRHTKWGLEFAFGPTLSLSRQSEGYFDKYNVWHQKNDWKATTANPYPITTRIDSRGDYIVTPGFVFGIGKTFKSGDLNIPINAYVVPRKDGFQYGLSFGYNAKKETPKTEI